MTINPRLDDPAFIREISDNATTAALNVFNRNAPFIGALPAATQAGYGLHTIEQNIFISVFLHVLGRHMREHHINYVQLDDAGLLIREP